MTVRFGSTVNLGNFNSARFDVEASAELEAGDDPRNVANQLHELCREEARRQARPIVQRNNRKLDDVFHHLPDDVQEIIMEALENAD